MGKLCIFAAGNILEAVLKGAGKGAIIGAIIGITVWGFLYLPKRFAQKNGFEQKSPPPENYN